MRTKLQQSSTWSKTFLFVTMLILVFTVLPVMAAEKQSKSKWPKPAGAVNSGSGGVYQVGQYGVTLKYRNFTKKQLYDGDEEIAFVRPRPGQRGTKTYEQSMSKLNFVLRAKISMSG